ncbi:ABC transporter substrate-binding protein [Streptomyces sp. WAC06614]|uniref:ABC transporter substrate-binding protein n=1 Tax=Streptomyces sp. WAC06614 TaxID=2487416 RepID=UPI000F77F9D0|nr:ABC transporter substrate-binding protein [Streptomyces sp. WAC06614]RSS83895.1 ABC transporter substrate-binding protein [Streptomyces sp. WAC06614]
MPQSRANLLTRRGILAAGGVLALGGALAACGDKKEGSGKGGGDGKAWSFKDDRGTDVTAKSTPKNIVAFVGTAAALYDFGIKVKGVFGPTRTADGKADVQAGSMDISKVEIIGNVYGEFNIEKYAALNPELLVTNMWVKDDPWYVPAESKDKILGMAPSAMLFAGPDTTVPNAIARHAALAESLGADLKAPAVASAKARFEKAAERLRSAAKANPGLKVLIGSGSAELFYVSVPKMSADTKYFQELGLTFVEPTPNAEGFFEELSWENAGKYPADLIMLDNRTGTLQDAELKAGKPTWAGLPAVKAGQVVSRVTEPIFSYDKCAQLLEDLAAAVEKAKKVS